MDGGRVRVDFNHPLAGKVIEYDLEVISQINDSVEKVKSIVRYFTAIIIENIKVILTGKEVEINIVKHDINRKAKEGMADAIIKWVKDVEKVKFVDIFGK